MERDWVASAIEKKNMHYSAYPNYLQRFSDYNSVGTSRSARRVTCLLQYLPPAIHRTARVQLPHSVFALKRSQFTE